MRSKLPVVAAATALAALGGTAGASAASPTEAVVLAPVAGSAVRGTATLGANAAGTKVRVALSGLAPGAHVRVLLHAGKWPNLSASFAVAASARADGKGAARARSAIRFHDEPVSWRVVADGGHVLTVVVGGKVVARAAIPGMS